LEHQLVSLDLSDFNTIEDYISNFKLLRLELKDYKVEKIDDGMIMAVLSKLRGHFLVFVSTFYSTMDAFSTEYKMPTFTTFYEELSMKQDKLIQMGSLTSNSSKNQALISNQQNSERQGKSPSRDSKGPKSGFKNQVTSSSRSPKQ